MKRINKKKKTKGMLPGKNKKFFGSFAGLFALVIIINATLAWSSYSEWVKNHTQSNPEEVAVSVKEEFTQDSVLDYTVDVDKKVQVKNISKRDAIIRVSFNESFLPFVMNMEDGPGAGGLKTFKYTNEAFINTNHPKTWKVGNLLDSGKTDGAEALYYKATSPIHVNVPYKGEGNRSAELDYFKWIFNVEVYSSPQFGQLTPYWVFDGEYFYYSRVVAGDGLTTSLLEKVGLQDKNIPNKYKSALYDIQVIADGVVPTKSGLANWTNDADLLKMYQEDDKFK